MKKLLILFGCFAFLFNTVFGQEILQKRSPVFTYSNDYSVELDGVDEFVTMSDHHQYSFGNGGTDSAFTLVIWMYRDTAVGNMTLMSKFDANGMTTAEWYFAIIGTTLRIAVCNNTGTANVVGRTAPMASQKTWIGLAATYNGNEATNGFKLYSLSGGTVTQIDNNNLSAGAYTGMSNTTASLRIGKLETGGVWFFNGGLYYPQIYDAELTSTQLDEIADNPYKDARTYSFASSLVTAWYFPQGTANYPDWIGIGNAAFNGVLQNMTSGSIQTDKP